VNVPMSISAVGPLSIVGALLAVAIGVLYCFFGYRLFKIILGIAGFIWGAGLVGGVVFTLTQSTVIAIIAGVLGGALFAVLAVVLYYIGVFILGAYLGGALSIFIMAFFGLATPVWLLLVLAIAGGVVAVIFKRFMIIVASAFVGAWAIVFGVSYLIPKSSGGAYLYIAFAAWLALGITGMVVQYKVTAKKKLAEERRKES